MLIRLSVKRLTFLQFLACGMNSKNSKSDLFRVRYESRLKRPL